MSTLYTSSHHAKIRRAIYAYVQMLEMLASSEAALQFLPGFIATIRISYATFEIMSDNAGSSCLLPQQFHSNSC